MKPFISWEDETPVNVYKLSCPPTVASDNSIVFSFIDTNEVTVWSFETQKIRDEALGTIKNLIMQSI
jgi:hypothetical protein